MERKRLNEVLILNQSGTWGDEGNENDFPVLRSSNIQDGRLTLDDLVYRKVAKNKIDEFKLEDGDILVTKSSGSSHLIGKCCLFKNPNGKTFLYSNFTQRLRVNKSILLPELLFHYLNSSFAKEYLQKISNTTSGLRNLNMKDYAKQLIPILPMAEQQKIASILAQADAARQKRKQANQLTEQFLQSAFLEMFGDLGENKNGYKVFELKDLCTKVTDGEHNIPPRTESGIPLVMARNVRDGYLDLTELDFISEEDHIKANKRCNPEEGDILLVCVGATIGRLTIVPRTNPFSIVRSVALIKPDKKINSQYLLKALQSNYVQAYMMSRRSTSAQAGLYLNQIQKIPIPLPPLPLQQKFAALVKQVERLRTRQRESERELDNLFQSLMQRYFG